MKAFLDVVWQTLIWPSCFEAHQWFTSCGEPSVFTLVKSSLDCWLWHTYTYLLESVLDLANCCEGCFLHQGKNSSVIHHSCFPWSSGSFGVAELTGAFLLFKNVSRTVVLATPNVFAISLMGLFCFFSLMMACFTDSDSFLDLILTVDSNRFQMQIAHLKWTLDLLSAHCNWDNEGITHTWPWNSWEANCPITFGPLTSGRHIRKPL